ncbi:flavodoxin domain-containing protein [Pseudarthrobacter sp. NPDC089323]
MAHIVIPYGTSEGQTARIAEFIADVLRAHGHDVDAVDLKHSDHLLAGKYDAAVVGASIHMGKHEEYVRDFVLKNREALEGIPSALFSVSLAAHGDMENAEQYVAQFEEETGWHPARVALFGGALLYTQYGLLKRMVMKKIAQDKGGLDTDTSRDYIYTEWDGVRRFAEDFAAGLEPKAVQSNL